jgi:hypothetical protein
MKMTMTMMMVLAVGMAGCAGYGSGSSSGSGNDGATGAAPARYMGERGNVNGTYNGSTSSSSMLEQRIKQDSAKGAPSGGGDTKY